MKYRIIRTEIVRNCPKFLDFHRIYILGSAQTGLETDRAGEAIQDGIKTVKRVSTSTVMCKLRACQTARNAAKN